MAFRNPLYLDTDLLSNLADYFGLDRPSDRDVTRRTSGTGTKGVGFEKVASAKLESVRAEEITETYSLTARPVRLMNDLVDTLTSEGHIVDLDVSQEPVVTSGSVVQLSGDLLPSAANEVGAVMARFLPLLMSGLESGVTSFNPSEAEMAQAFFGEQGTAHPQLFELEPTDAELPGPCLLLLDPNSALGTTSLEDLEGEQSVIAHVDRFVRPGSTVKLDKYVFPGLSRTARRAMSRGRDREKLLAGLDKVIGRPITTDDLEVKGPALMLKPLAIY